MLGGARDESGDRRALGGAPGRGRGGRRTGDLARGPRAGPGTPGGDPRNQDSQAITHGCKRRQPQNRPGDRGPPGTYLYAVGENQDRLGFCLTRIERTPGVPGGWQPGGQDSQAITGTWLVLRGPGVVPGGGPRAKRRGGRNVLSGARAQEGSRCSRGGPRAGTRGAGPSLDRRRPGRGGQLSGYAAATTGARRRSPDQARGGQGCPETLSKGGVGAERGGGGGPHRRAGSTRVRC